LGFIGAGWWATTNHMPLLRARGDVKLVSVCGLDPSLLDRVRRDFGFVHVTTDHRRLLEQKLDAVVIATPPPLHFEHARDALRAGLHVMVEKPMTTRADQARTLVRLAREKGLHLLVPYGWHYRPPSRKAKELVSAGAVGDVEFVACRMGSPNKNLFSGTSFDWEESSYTPANLSTYADPELSGGGYGQGQLSHLLALLTWLTDLRAESVFARMSGPGADVDMYDSLSVRFVGGALGTFSGAATAPGHMRHQLELHLYGSKGMLIYGVAPERLELHTHSGEHLEIPFSPEEAAYRCDEPPHQFAELILGLTHENDAPGDVAVRAVEILDAAYRSVRSGRDEPAAPDVEGQS